MTESLSSLFVQPISITGFGRLAMLFPLALSISVVYKTMRCERLATIPIASLVLCFMILACMGLIGVVLMLIFHLLA